MIILKATGPNYKGVIRVGENLPKRKMGEFKISDEQVNQLKTISAVTKMLADNPQMTKEIADIFVEIEIEKQRELVERVTKLLAEKVPEVSSDQIKATFSYWYMVSGQWITHSPRMCGPTSFQPYGQWIH